LLLKPKEVNQIAKGTVIFQEQEAVTHICIILKGHVMAMNRGSKIILSQGYILGIPDLYIGRYLCDYVVYEDALIYPFPVSSVEDVERILTINKEYSGLMVYSLSNQIKKINAIAESLRECADSLYTFVQDNYKKYESLCNKNKQVMKPIPKILKLEAYEPDLLENEKTLEYYLECSKVPLGAVKEYYASSTYLTMWHIEEASGIIASQLMECMEVVSYLDEIFMLLMNTEDNSLFMNTAELFLSTKANGIQSKEIMEMIDLMVDEINRTDLLCERNTNCKLTINRAKFEESYCTIISGATELKSESEVESMNQQQMIDSLKNSFYQIFAFSSLDKAKEIELADAINTFMSFSDRLSQDNEVRETRKKITSGFYELYEDVFKLAHGEVDLPKAVELFLNFGLLDERLVTAEQLASLCKISIDAPCETLHIYTVREWLTLIYEGKKEPSKNEFDLEYVDYIREQKKHEVMTPEEERRRLHDINAKLHYEIINMFMINDKVVSGQLSTFLPCLYKEMFLNFPEKEFINRQRIKESFERILGIDYSAFYREALYVNKEAGIEKEYIVKNVFPDIILLPIAGSNSSMWQEISQKKRVNPGRFVFPIFLDTNIDDNMIRLIGRFRWELCRSVQGTSWNNIQQKSLTSEYMDYIQFYKKNHDLTEDKRDKIKTQIQRARSNSREVFVIDYEAWIKNESTGAIRLNKVAREIIATYCPFHIEVRQKILLQPIFAEAYARYNRNTTKKLRELDLRMRAMQNNNATITKEIMDTMVFYKEM
jgi:hypothetical protein